MKNASVRLREHGIVSFHGSDWLILCSADCYLTAYQFLQWTHKDIFSVSTFLTNRSEFFCIVANKKFKLNKFFVIHMTILYSLILTIDSE